MYKDFDGWNVLKQAIHLDENTSRYLKAGQIWWCSLGVNIGIETDGKNDKFERPVLILRVFSNEHLVILPIRSNGDSASDYFFIIYNNERKPVYVSLTQVRTVSSRRLIRHIGSISASSLERLKDKFIKLFC